MINDSGTIHIWWGLKGDHTIPKGLLWEFNVIAQMEFELVHYDITVQQLATTPWGLPPVLRGKIYFLIYIIHFFH